jgi:hypothetical protein
VRKPYYLENRDTWMVWLNGRQEKLGKDMECKFRLNILSTLLRSFFSSPLSGSLLCSADARDLAH